MIRWLLMLLGGALLGGIVHIATVIILPRTATQDAYSRLIALAPVNKVTPLPPPQPGAAIMPLMPFRYYAHSVPFERVPSLLAQCGPVGGRIGVGWKNHCGRPSRPTCTHPYKRPTA